MNAIAYPRITPWVWRLIIANAVVLLLLQTVFPALVPSLRFTPSLAAVVAAPWTLLSYMFVHGGLLHLAFNMLMLFFLGTRVEQRMGGRAFILFYLYCGLGGALLSLALPSIAGGPMVGASAAVLGVAVAYAMYWPDQELLVFPLPMPIRARTLILALIALDAVSALAFSNSGVAHLAHLGGAMFGFVFFRLQSFYTRRPAPVSRPVERVVMLQTASRQPDQAAPAPARRSARRSDPDPLAAEIDRVLDKISAHGMSSLTTEERLFLTQVSEQKKRTDLN